MSNSDQETKGNAPGPKQGVRPPNAGEIEPANRRLDQHPHQTAEVPYGSGNEPEVAGKGGLDPEPAASPDSAHKHTEPMRRK